MDTIEELVAARWAKYNADKALLLAEARRDVKALYAADKAERSRKPKSSEPEVFIPAPDPLRPGKPDQSLMSRNRYWADQYYKGLLPPEFDWSNMPPIPEDDDG